MAGRPAPPPARRRGAVPDDAARDAALDQLTRCFGVPSKSNAFGRLRGSSASSASVTFGSNTRSPIRPAKKLRSSSSASPLKRVDGEVLEQLGDRVRLEHGAVARRARAPARRASARPSRPPRARSSAGRRRRRRQRSGSRSRRRRRRRRARAHRRVGHPLRGREAGGRGDRELDHAAREEAVDGRAPPRRSRPSRARAWSSAPSAAVSSSSRRRRAARRAARAPGSPGRRRALATRRRRARASAARPSSSVRLRRGDAGAPVADDAGARRPRCRSASAGAPPSAAKRARPERSAVTTTSASSPLGARERALRELEAAAHALTPTWTSRKRAGDAPCETCACWPGWPLPQFVRPCSTHSSGPATRVERAPETGVTPGVGRVAEHPAELAVLDLPGDLRPELEVEALVVDRPALVRLAGRGPRRPRRSAPRASPRRARDGGSSSGRAASGSSRRRASTRRRRADPRRRFARGQEARRGRPPRDDRLARGRARPRRRSAKVPRPRGVVASAVMFMCSEP